MFLAASGLENLHRIFYNYIAIVLLNKLIINFEIDF